MEFDLPKEMSSIIKVIGVGGGGSNAVNHMFNQGIIGVDFIVCNTDKQALDISPVPHKIQLGKALTEGRGAGMLPEVGMNAAIENIEELREVLSNNTKMVFVTAGMGGGTGTGAAPVIAQVAKDLGILTVGIVTVPFSFEGRKRRQQAEEGLERMRQNVDTLLIINNEKLRDIGKNMALTQAFAQADNILTTAAKGIAEVISVTGNINVDFNDVNTVLRNSGRAIMGSAIAQGENRAIEAVQSALSSPLLDENDIQGAKYVLLNITYGDKEVMMDEVTEITDFIQDAAGATADVIWGHGYDSSLGDNISITLIATGFSSSLYGNGYESAPERVVVNLTDEVKKEIISPLVSPTDQSGSVTENEISSLQEPFLKQDVVQEDISFSTAPVENVVIDNKVVFDLFDSASELESVSNEVELEEESHLTSDAIQNETPTNDIVWDVVGTFDVNQELNQKMEVIEEPIIVRHQLEDEPAAPVSLNSSQNSANSAEQIRRTEEYKAKLQSYTQKLKGADGIAEFENEPAYVRRNIQINQTTPSTENNVSRFGLSDDASGSGLRNNNFLHDNVD